MRPENLYIIKKYTFPAYTISFILTCKGLGPENLYIKEECMSYGGTLQGFNRVYTFVLALNCRQGQIGNWKFDVYRKESNSPQQFPWVLSGLGKNHFRNLDFCEFNSLVCQ
eukprot:TRINITY_DN7948_c0_g1_i4.p2 TRINITY_DN7948_c0_g1~~TRINITY_DN7948_c0_g1_i4.p2  ORF type:complete len:111 (-),score=6.30 TRINITY_DN7948_c0_g1_i4:75-407(-)